MDKQKIRNVLLSVIAAIASAAAIGIWNFYREWTIDEETEESQMFDDPEQKVRVLRHVDLMNVYKVREQQIKDSVNDVKVIETLEKISKTVNHADSIAKLNAVQVFQMKEKLEK